MSAGSLVITELRVRTTLAASEIRVRTGLEFDTEELYGSGGPGAGVDNLILQSGGNFLLQSGGALKLQSA